MRDIDEIIKFAEKNGFNVSRNKDKDFFNMFGEIQFYIPEHVIVIERLESVNSTAFTVFVNAIMGVTDDSEVIKDFQMKVGIAARIKKMLEELE